MTGNAQGRARALPSPSLQPGDAPPAEPSREHLLLRGAASIERQVRAARKDPGAFIEFVMRTPSRERIKLAYFHREWLELFRTARRTQVQAPKAHGKTSNLLGYLCWAIGTNPNTRIKLFAQSEARARERLSVVSNMIEHNKLVKLVFPHLKPSSGPAPWTKMAIQVERAINDKEPTLQVLGIMGTAEGGRADLVVFDDISDFRTSLVYPQHRETIKQKVHAEILPMLEANGRAVSVATPHHEQDVVASLSRNPEWDSRIYRVGTEEDPFLPLWPQRWPRLALRRLHAELGPLEYNRAYRCIALTNASQMVRPEYIQYYDAETMGSPWNLYCLQAYDLAGTAKKRSNKTACVTLLYDPKRHIVFVADAWAEKLDFIDQANAVIQGAKAWRPDKIVVEETGYQAALRGHLVDANPELLPTICPVSPGNLSKDVRLAKTLPMFSAGRVYFNPALDPNANPHLGAHGDIVTQLVNFVASSEKDLGDAFAHGMRVIDDVKRTLSRDDSGWKQGRGLATRLTLIG